LEIRGQQPESEYVCEHCDTKFTQKVALTKHMKKCWDVKKVPQTKTIDDLNKKINCLEKGNKTMKLKLKQKDDHYSKLIEKNKKVTKELEELKLSYQQQSEELKEKKTKIKEQQSKIISLQNEMATEKGIVIGMNNAKPQVINNSSTIHNKIVQQKLLSIPITHINPFTIDLVNQNIDKYDYKTFLRGGLGIAHFIKELTILELDDGTIEKNYACTDRSRNSFHRLVEDKRWKEDGGARFIQEILSALAEPASVHMDTLTEQLKNEPVQSPNKLALLSKQIELGPLEFGLRCERSKERETVFNQVKNKMKNTNGC
jgi:hypothetical protein